MPLQSRDHKWQLLSARSRVCGSHWQLGHVPTQSAARYPANTQGRVFDSYSYSNRRTLIRLKGDFLSQHHVAHY
jgi:hypothetical protein